MHRIAAPILATLALGLLAAGCTELQHLGLELCTSVTEFGLKAVADPDWPTLRE